MCDKIEELPKIEIEIIDFIAERELELNEQLKKEVIEKFGDAAKEIFSDVADGLDDEDMGDCPGCDELDENIEHVHKIMQQLSDVLSSEYHEVVDRYCAEYKVLLSYALRDLIKEMGISCDKKDIELIKKKIMLHGIINGWLDRLWG